MQYVTRSLSTKYSQYCISKFTGLRGIYSHNIFVGPKGNDEDSCGKFFSPCKTIRFAVSNISKDGDTILIDYARQQPYNECESCAPSKSAITIDKSLSIFGHSGIAFIRCRYRCILFEVRGNGIRRSRIEFANLSLSMAQTAINYVTTSSDLVLKNCWLKKNRIGISLRSSPHVLLLVVNSVFQDNYEWGVYSKKCINMSSVFVSCNFLSSLVLLETNQVQPISWQEFHTFIWNCTFRSDRKYLGQKCPTLLSMKTVSMATNITVRKSIFSNSFGLCHAFSITEATNTRRVTTFISLDKLLVENNRNDRAVMFINPFYKRPSKFKVKIINSVFQNNTARTVHAEIKRWRFYTFPQSVYILFNNNTFAKNGYFVHPPPALYSPVLYLKRGRHRLYGCTFEDNYPHGTPNSAVVVPSNSANIVIKDCLFSKTNTTKSLQIYAEPSSRIVFKGTTIFTIIATLSDQVIVEHEPFTPSMGNVGQVEIRGTVHMICPSGYRFNFMNHNLHGQILTWIYFYASCVQCPRKTYSIEKGKLKNNITNDISCYNCPRGAVCESGQLYVKRGFWGNENNDHKVLFKSCPFGYCCEEETCNSYSYCHGNRTGTLCGRCPEGTSEPLFTTECRINEDCTAPGFWIFFSILLILYLVFFLFHEEITRFFTKSFPSRQNSNNRNSTQQSGPQNNSSSASGYLKIFFFYYQMVHIILESIPSGHHAGSLSKVKSSVSQVINMIIVNFSSQDCPFKSLRPISKSVFLHSLGFWLLFLIFLIYLLYTFLSWIKQRQRKNGVMLSNLEDTNDLRTQNSNNLFRIRIGCAFTYVCLLMYTSSAKLCFSLLNCVQVGKDRVLFIDGTVKCYQTYQYFLMAYIVFSVLPFCFVPVLGCYLLFLKRISPRQLYLGCLFPLPYCCYWSYNLIKYCKEPTDIEINDVQLLEHSRDGVNRQALLQILSGPFRTHKRFFGLPNSKIPWEGALILCRLIVILSLTLSSDNRVRALIMMVICLVMLVSHMYIRPFISVHENFLATLSLCSIIIVCALSLLKAVYYGEDCSSLPESQFLLIASDRAINILLTIPVALLAFLVFMVLFVKLTHKLFVLLKYMKTAMHIRLRGNIINNIS